MFPDEWTNTGMPEKFRYFCLGNALIVGLVERMGVRLREVSGETPAGTPLPESKPKRHGPIEAT